MDIMMKLTLRHLKSNIKRTIVTILGVVASTALMTAMLVGIYSTFMFVGDVSILVDGNYHALFKDLTKEEIEKLRANDQIKCAGIRDYDNEKSGFYIDGDEEIRFRTGNICAGDADFCRQIVTCKYDGTLPANAGEIAVEEEFLKNNHLNLGIGDSLTFHQGYRYTYEQGKPVYLGGAYRSNEEFNESSLETCVITAILHKNEPTASYKIIRGMDADYVPEENLIYASLKHPNIFAVSKLQKIAEECGVSVYEYNSEYLMSVFVLGIPGSPVNAIYHLLALAVIIIMIVSVIMISNAFGMSLTERMKYLGMLASVGATKKQKRQSVYYEGLLLGVFGIPVGFFIGMLGCIITIRITGAMVINTEMIRGVESGFSHIPVRCHPLIVFIVVIMVAVTIFLSSLIPAVRASKITPIDALRSAKDIKLRAWKLKTLPFARLLFGYEGELAVKNIKRNGLKGVVITVSMAASIIMFLCIIYFVDLFNQSNSYEIEIPFQVYASASLNERDKLKEDLLKIDGVDKIFVAEMFSFNYYGKDENGEPRKTPNMEIRNPKFLADGYKDLFSKDYTIWIIPVEDKRFNEILAENGIDEAPYYTGELKGVLLDNYNHEKTKKRVFNDSVLGQKIYYDKPENNPPAVTVADFVRWNNKTEEFKLSPRGSISVYVPVSRMDEEYVKNIDEEELSCTLGIQTKDHKGIYRKVNDLLTYGDYHNTSCSDIEGNLMIMKALMSMIKTVLYGFTILISLVLIANIVNTISTGVQMRRKEFAMFKSVGMTNGGFKKMLFLETFLIGFRAVLVGVPLSVLLSFLMLKALSFATVPFEINPWSYVFAILGVFGIVGISMLLSTSKARHDSVVDVLKEDIC